MSVNRAPGMDSVSEEVTQHGMVVGDFWSVVRAASVVTTLLVNERLGLMSVLSDRFADLQFAR